MTQPPVQPNLELALEHVRAGRWAEAEAVCREVLARQPQNAGALHMLGMIAGQGGRLEEGIELVGRAVQLAPGHAFFQGSLAEMYRRAGRLNEAIAMFRRALALNPKMADAENNLGTALAAAGQLEEAIAAYRRSLILNPKLVQAYNNMGNALQATGRGDEAIAAVRQAVALDPNWAEIHNNLGSALLSNGKLDEAISAIRRALKINPNLAEAHNNLGNALKDQGLLDEAIASYQMAYALKPEFATAESNRLYTMQFHIGYDDEALGREQRNWNERYVRRLKHSIRRHSNDRSRDRRLRVGYVSPYFYSHAESFSLLPLLESHDHERFEIHAYSDARRTDDVTVRTRRAVDAWQNCLGRSDGEVAEKIRQDGIDILVDLAMHMAENRPGVFAQKPAPVQVNWLAYPGATGLETMDYRITDRFMDPPEGETRAYREEPVWLGDAWSCYDPLCEVPPAAARGEGPVRFGSVNNPCKLNEPTLRIWAEVIRSVADSRLALQVVSREHRDRLIVFFDGVGVDESRLDFVPRRQRGEYLRMYDSIDIGLDPLPYNGITTTCDALWMGVPVISLIGKTAAGRAGLSLLTAAGLPELVARDADQFVRIAVELAGDGARRAEMRSTQREKVRGSPLMDGPRFARNMEAAYRRMWDRWCEGSEA